MTAVDEMTWQDTAGDSTHSWMPSSPCGTKCVDRDSMTVGNVAMATRVVGIGGLFLTFPVANAVVPRVWKEEVQQRYARALLRCCGIDVKVIDNRGDTWPGMRYASPGDGAFIVSGHVGWTDILAIAAVQPVSFVARADMTEWPVLGQLAKRMRVIPIDRSKLKALPGVVRQIADRISAGERIVAFPEGTTWCGRAYGSLRPALFQAAIDTATPVQPIQLTYRRANGTLTTLSSFVGDDSMVDSLLRILRSDGIVAEIVLQPIEQPGTDRRDLAARCERAVRGQMDLDFAEHGVLESAAARNTAQQPKGKQPEEMVARIA